MHGSGAYAAVEGFSGHCAYAHLRLAYRLTSAWILALGYQCTEIDVTLDRSAYEANFDSSLGGFTLTLAYSF